MKAKVPNAVAGIALAVAVFAGPGTCLGDGDDSDVLFAIRDYTHSGITVSGPGQRVRILIEPFAFLANGKLANLPDDIDSTSFGQKYYAKHHKYRLYSSGKDAGTVEIKETAFDIQCESLAAEATVSPPGMVAGMRMALASNATFTDGGYARRAPSPEERLQLMDLARRVYAAHMVRAALIAKVQVSNITVFDSKTGPLLIGSFTIDHERKEESGVSVDVHAVFIIAELKALGEYGATYSWFHTGNESTIETQDLVDIVDLDGDGIPEVVTQFGYYEAVEYHVYKRIQGTWSDIYKNFGAGC